MSHAKRNRKQNAPRRPGQPPKAAAANSSKRGRARLAGALLGLSIVAVLAFVLTLKFGQKTPSQNQPTGGDTAPAVASLSNSNPVTSGVAAQRNKDKEASELNQLANNLLRAGDNPAAIQTYKQALALTPTDEDLHFNLGIAFAKNGQLTNAEYEYHEALRLLPDYPEVHNNLGNVLMRLGKNEEAEEHFKEALKAMPEYAQAHNNLGILRRQQKQTNEALLCFQKAVQFDTNYWEAHFNLASAYLQGGQREKGIEELRETLRLNPQFKMAQEILERQLAMNSNSPAVPAPAPQN